MRDLRARSELLTSTPRHLAGTEPVLAENAAKRGRLQFALPGVQPRAKVRLGRADVELALALDTAIVEPDEQRLVLVWRGTCEVHGRVRSAQIVPP
jgi:hypothetical protein